MSQNLYIVFGTGPDAVGLVEKVTAPVAAIQGNIVDLRQDVLHGLFTLFMVVDLSRATVPAEGVAALVARISEEIEQYLTELGTDGRLVRLQLREVQRQLGHSHVETTEIYTHTRGDGALVSPLDRVASIIPFPQEVVRRKDGTHGG